MMSDNEPLVAGGNGDATREPRALSSILLERYAWAKQAGITFGGARDMYEILGYAEQVTVRQYVARYERGGIAGRIVDLLPKATWRGDMWLEEDADPTIDTPFEAAWDILERRLKIKAMLQRVDLLSRLSTYAVLLIGASGDLSTELPRGRPESLLYLQPFLGGGGPGGSNMSRAMAMDADASILEFETDPTNVRFGLPKFYQLKRVDVSSPALHRQVHWSRILHVAEGCLRDDVYGLPALERVWNDLDNLEKVVGGGSESFWLRANQGMHLDLDKDMALADAKDTLAALKEQSEDYKHQVTRWLRTRGVEVKMLGSDVANFSNPADAIVTLIAGATGIPKRLLVGSEMGELASSQDRENFKDLVNGRQTSYAGPYIVRPFVDRLVAYGYLPTPTEPYEVRWPHVEVLSEMEKADGAKRWAETNQVAGAPVYTISEIREHWQGLAPLEQSQIDEMTPEPVVEPPVEDPALKAAQSAEMAETLRALEAAIEQNDTAAIDEMLGVTR